MEEGRGEVEVMAGRLCNLAYLVGYHVLCFLLCAGLIGDYSSTAPYLG